MRQLFIGLVLLLPRFLLAQSQYVFSPLQSNQGLSENRVRNINQLEDGRMLIITEGMISLYNGTSFKDISVDEENLTPLTKYNGFHHSYVEGKKRLWLKNGGRLVIVDLLKERFENRPQDVLRSLGVHDSLADIYMDSQDNIWFLTQNDDLLYRDAQDGKTRRFLTEVSDRGGPAGALYDLAVQNKQVFLFYNSGLLICMDLKTGKELYRDYAFSQYEKTLHSRTLFVVQHKQNLLQLRNGKKGLMLNYDTRSRKWLKVLETDYWLNCVSVDKDENIWVSCKNGLWLIDKSFTKKTFLPTLQLVDGRELNNEVSTLFNDNQGGLWIGSLNRGLLYHHSQRFKFKNFGRTLFKGFQHKELLVSSFTENEQGEVLVGTNNGYYKYSAEGTFLVPCSPPVKATPVIKIEPLNSITPSSVRQLIKWKQGYLGLSGRELFEYDPKTRELSYPHRNSRKLPMFRHNNHDYNCILADSRGLLWFGTADGAYFWDENQRTLSRISRSEGLNASSIKSIIEDKNQDIWLTTSNGIAKIVLKKEKGKYRYVMSCYNKYDGLIENEFIERSAFVTKNGRLLVGGIEGFNELNTNAAARHPHHFNPIFSDFQLYGKSLNQNVRYDGNVVLKNSIASTKDIVLNHNQNFFTVSFSSLNYINPTQTYFRYMLEGVEPGWQELSSSDGSAQATYTSLAPGAYTFKVQATDNSKNWTGKTAILKITIEPPFWNTRWAHLFYLVLFIFTVYRIFGFYTLKNRRKLALEQKEKLDEAKFNFFTNMSHELRTPLSLIISPLEAILKKQEHGELRSQLEGVYRNARNLLSQVTHLLDFRRMELYGEKLCLSYCDISEYLDMLCEPFRPLAYQKDIVFTVHSTISGTYAYLDRDKVSKIVNNLLSNAFKFTKQGAVTVNITKVDSSDSNIQYLSFEVSDTGVGIPAEDQERIFERFNKADNQHESNTGTGIGLYLVMEYVKLHTGDVRVESTPGKGSKFIVTIPLNLAPEVQAEHIDGSLEGITDNKLKVLIAEDNAEFRAFLSAQLKGNYSIIEAVDGKDGLEKALSNLPDLVISDLMMPGMNGLELCSALKTDLRTSHIPVIILTARSSEDIQFEGYNAGADAFISKPFNADLLLLRIRKLIEQQEQRKMLFKQSLVLQPDSLTASSLDEKLIIRALECVERNLSNCDYSVEQLSSDLNMDRTGLYRKLVALTGTNPTLFIRSVRLKRAARLLQEGEFNISEISEKVGFKTVPYFSKCFQDEFGVKPSQFARDLIK